MEDNAKNAYQMNKSTGEVESLATVVTRSDKTEATNLDITIQPSNNAFSFSGNEHLMVLDILIVIVAVATLVTFFRKPS